MSIEAVRAFFKEKGLEDRLREYETSSATVPLAAAAAGVSPGEICKTLSFACGGGALLLLAAGDAKIDNAKFKAEFGMKAVMLKPEAVPEFVGHEVGGVCPFCVKPGVKVYADVSLRRFDAVYPAAGNAASAVRLTPDELFAYADAVRWADVCKDWA